MWIFGFTRWVFHFLIKSSKIDAELKLFLDEMRRAALIKPMDEWKPYQWASSTELILFIEELGEI